MQTIHIVRHAQSTTNATGTISGTLDVDLSLEGVEQAEKLGNQLESHYDVAIVSTLRRTLRTVNIAARHGGVKIDSIIRTRALNEIDMGVLTGERRRWIKEYAEGDFNYAPEEGESYRQVSRRVYEFMRTFLSYAAAENYRTILICTHMAPMRILYGLFSNTQNPKILLKQHFKNTELIRVVYSNKELQLPLFLQG